MANDNYTCGVYGFSTDNYYALANAGALNAVNAQDGSFGAYATFMLAGAYQDPTQAPVRQYLWGNADDANFTGWSIELVGDLNNDLQLQVKVGTGATYVTVLAQLSGAGGQSCPIEKLLMAALWFDATDVYLSVNGVLKARAPLGAPYAPSALVGTLGAGGALAPTAAAPLCKIVSTGYEYNVALTTFAGLIGQSAGDSFSSARETFGAGNVLSNPLDTPWTRQYSVRNDVQGLVGAITKNSSGAFLPIPVSSPATLSDIGNQSAVAASTIVGLATADLSLVGNALPLISRKNVDWIDGGPTAFDAP